MDDIRRFYDYFTSEHTSWYLVDADGTLMCADKSRNIGKKLEEDWYKNIAKKPDGRYQITGSGKTYTVLSQNLSYLGCHMYGVIDNEMAIQDLYNMPLLILICAVTAGFIMLLCLFYLQKTLHPLSNLVSKMAISRRKEFREYIPVEGTCEVQQLASTYNEMLDDIQNYIGERCCVFIRGKHPVCGEPLFCFSANPDSLCVLCGFHIDHRSSLLSA